MHRGRRPEGIAICSNEELKDQIVGLREDVRRYQTGMRVAMDHMEARMDRRIDELESRVQSNEKKLDTAVFTSDDFEPALRDAIWDIATSKRTLIFVGLILSVAAAINQILDAGMKAMP